MGKQVTLRYVSNVYLFIHKWKKLHFAVFWRKAIQGRKFKKLVIIRSRGWLEREKKQNCLSLGLFFLRTYMLYSRIEFVFSFLVLKINGRCAMYVFVWDRLIKLVSILVFLNWIFINFLGFTLLSLLQFWFK